MHKITHFSCLLMVTVLPFFSSTILARDSVFRIPRLRSITIDGSGEDWAERGFRVSLVFPVNGQGMPQTLKHVSDHDVQARLGWDDQGLLMLINRSDDQWVEEADPATMGARDAIELFLSPSFGDSNICQWVIGPGMTQDQPDVRSHLFDHRKDAAIRDVDASLTLARSKEISGNCLIEMRVPWAALGITPEAGREVALQFWSRDIDGPDDTNEYFAAWYPGMGAYRDSTRMHRVVLDETASSAVRTRIQPRYNLSTHHPMVEILGAPALIGKTVEIQNGGKSIATATLSTSETGHASAVLALPPIKEQPYRELQVLVDGAPEATITADNGIAWERAQRLGPGLNMLGYYHSYWRDDKGPSLLRADHFEQIKHAGFEHVRICLLSPSRFMDDKMQLSEDWLKRMDWVVEQALAAKLQVILDLHAQGAHADFARERRQLLAFWEQVSQRYQALPDTVLFEIMNEPHGSLTDDKWKLKWNRLQSEAIQVIRRTNPQRTLVVTPAHWFSIVNLVHLELPVDDRNLITSIHYYSPITFTHQGADASWFPNAPPIGTMWGSAAEYQAVKDDLTVARRWSERTGRPIILGEFGVMNLADTASRARWMSHVARTAERNGFPWTAWYFETGEMALFDVERDTWDQPILDALFPKK